MSIRLRVFAFLVPLVIAGAAYAQSAIVVDSTGKTVGGLVSEHVLTMRLKPTGHIVAIDITPGAIGVPANEERVTEVIVYKTGYFRAAAYYTSSDCSGQIYLTYDGFIKRAYLDPLQPNKIIYPDINAAPVTADHLGYKFKNKLFCFKFGPIAAYPVRSAGVGQQGFTPPFRLKN